MKIAFFGSDHEVVLLETETANMLSVVKEASRVDPRPDRLQIFLKKFNVLDGDADDVSYAMEGLVFILQALGANVMQDDDRTEPVDANENIANFTKDVEENYGFSITEGEDGVSISFFETEERFGKCMRTAVVINLIDATGEIFED
jgi:hypothetical protein